jgi:triosephosphate isomerase
MRQQIAAANWKMNLTIQKGEELLNSILNQNIALTPGRQVVFAVPFPYLVMAAEKIKARQGYFVAAQNASDKPAGAYTGEVSTEMLHSIGITHCVLGHSERREYFSEGNAMLTQKTERCLERGITPIFCCGEPLAIREGGTQEEWVERQLRESLFNFPDEQLRKIVIAYEPIWAIGTGKTATTLEAQEMHAHIRSVLAKKYGKESAAAISILYGGSVKGSNAKELFGCPDVDGGLVGGASLSTTDFTQIIQSLKG